MKHRKCHECFNPEIDYFEVDFGGSKATCSIGKDGVHELDLQECNGKELMEFYSTHQQLKAYLPIIRDMKTSAAACIRADFHSVHHFLVTTVHHFHTACARVRLGFG